MTNKTVANDASVDDFIASLDNPAQRDDSKTLSPDLPAYHRRTSRHVGKCDYRIRFG